MCFATPDTFGFISQVRPQFVAVVAVEAMVRLLVSKLVIVTERRGRVRCVRIDSALAVIATTVGHHQLGGTPSR